MIIIISSKICIRSVAAAAASLLFNVIIIITKLNMMNYLFFALECKCYRFEQHQSFIRRSYCEWAEFANFICCLDQNHTDAMRYTHKRTHAHNGSVQSMQIATLDWIHNSNHDVGCVPFIIISDDTEPYSRIYFVSPSHWSLNYQFSIGIIDVENCS